MRKPLVAANWKMYGSLGKLASYLEKLRASTGEFDCDVALFPPYVFLQSAVGMASASNIAVGAQNVSEYLEGAFTGEVSSGMLVEIGCRAVLVGHSERRSLYGETNDVVAAKFVAALRSGLEPVLCVGETLDQREQGRTLEVVSQQLAAVVAAAGVEAVCGAVVAYEPVWAIGTGKTASPAQAQEVHSAIRGFLGVDGQKTRILYGGSVKAANAAELFAQPDIDGGLVGSASLDVDEFSAICRQAVAR